MVIANYKNFLLLWDGASDERIAITTACVSVD